MATAASVITKLFNHSQVLQFKQNTDFGTRATAHLFRQKQIRSLHWWVYELECAEMEFKVKADETFDEEEIVILEGLLLSSELDDFIYS